MTSSGDPTLLHTSPPHPPPPPDHGAPPPPPLGHRRHTPGQRDAGRLLPCALPGESVSGDFSLRHVLGDPNNNNNNNIYIYIYIYIYIHIYIFLYNHGLKMDPNHSFEHPEWSRITFGKTRF